MLGQLKCGKAHFHVGGTWLSQVKKIFLMLAFYLKEKYTFFFFFFFPESPLHLRVIQVFLKVVVTSKPMPHETALMVCDITTLFAGRFEPHRSEIKCP